MVVAVLENRDHPAGTVRAWREGVAISVSVVSAVVWGLARIHRLFIDAFAGPFGNGANFVTWLFVPLPFPRDRTAGDVRC